MIVNMASTKINTSAIRLKVLELRNGGHTYEEIGEAIGRSKVRAYQIYREAVRENKLKLDKKNSREIQKDVREFTFDHVVDVIGIAAACELCTGWGGKKVYVPHCTDLDHPVTLRLGPTAAQKLCSVFGGYDLYVPSEARILRSRREQLIVEELRAGATIAQMARKYGLSHKTVGNICKRRNIPRPPQ